ncbi:MAG: hypothetical protein ACKV2T_29435 [Kofleriaceae bacterium]
MTRLALVPIAFSLAFGCADDDPAPSATVRMATPESLTTDDDRLDDLTITVDYLDADGDLGGGAAEVHDCRNDKLVTILDIPAIAPDSVVDGDAGVRGSLDLHVNDVGATSSSVLPAACAELGIDEMGATEAVFCVILVDAAGHAGPGDCTSPIAIETIE